MSWLVFLWVLFTVVSGSTGLGTRLPGTLCPSVISELPAPSASPSGGPHSAFLLDSMPTPYPVSLFNLFEKQHSCLLEDVLLG